MLDKQKVKIMTELALYEQTAGKEDFKIDEYYRNDYVGFHSVCTVIWVTIGYVCAVGLGLFAGLDYILANISKSMIITLAIGIIGIYLAVVVVYVLIANYIYNKKHREARQRVKIFNHNLTKLLKMYEKEKR